MPVDWNDPWDDPNTLPSPGAYHYRVSYGQDTYSYTDQQVQQTGSLATLYPWMSPGVTTALGTSGMQDMSAIIDESYRQSLLEGYPGQKKRGTESKRKVRQAKKRIRRDAASLQRYADDLWSPQTKEDQAWLRALGVYGGEKKKDRAKAAELADILRSYLSPGAPVRETVRMGKQLTALFEGTESPDDFGAFVTSPLRGVAQTIELAAKPVGWYSENVTPPGRGLPWEAEANAVSRNVALAAQAPFELAIAGLRDFASDLEKSPETFGVLAKDNEKTGEDKPFFEGLKGLAEQTVAYQAWVEGKPVGEGLLPSYATKIDGEQSAADAAGEVARQSYRNIMIGDHAWTPGRAIADLVADPDDMAFQVVSGLVDATIAMKADPTNIALSSISSARKGLAFLTQSDEAADILRAAGARSGIRNQVNPRSFRNWLYNDGMPIVKAFKANTDWYVSKEAFPEIPTRIHRVLANMAPDAPDSDYLKVLMSLAPETRQAWNVNRVAGGRFILGAKGKMWATLPPNMIDLEDPDEAIKGLKAAGKWINAPEATVEKLVRMVGDSVPLRGGGIAPGQKEAIARATMGMYEEAYVAAGMSRVFAKHMTRLVKRHLDDSGVYDVAEGGIAAWFPLVRIGPDNLPLPDPALLTEMRNSAFALPEMRQTKRIISGLGQFVNFSFDDATGLPLDDTAKAFDAMSKAIDVADVGLGVWKQAVLMRPAWGLRVIAEEQLRMAAAGNFSLFRSPLSALAWVLGNPGEADLAKRFPAIAAGFGAAAGAAYGFSEGDWEDALVGALVGGGAGYAAGRHWAPDVAAAFQRVKTKYGQGAVDAMSGNFMDADDYEESLYGGFRSFLQGDGSEKVRTNFFKAIVRTDKNAPQAYAEELARLHADPVVQAVLGNADLAAVKNSFWDGDLSWMRKFLSDAPDRAGASRQWGELLTDRQLADDYIDYVADRLNRVANGNLDFMDAMRTGKWGNEPLTYKVGRNEHVPNPKLYENPAWVDAVSTTAPPRIRAEEMMTRGVSGGRTIKLFDSLFDALMPRPSNYLSRSPHFRQNYWKRIEELYPDMTSSARKTAMEGAENANLKRVVERMRFMDAELAKAGKTGGIKIKNADTIAKRFALDSTKDLLYDLSEKSQFFDATRLIFPFGEAWKEIITRWAKLIGEHPNLIRRAQQGLTAARQMEVDPITGLPSPGGIGLFHRDQTTGEEAFIYPLSGLINEQLVGVPVPLTGQVQGLNLVGNGLPGIGPVVSIPLAAIIPESPKWDSVREILFPYGTPQGSGLIESAADALVPAWIKKVDQAFSNPNIDRLQGNVTGAMMQYLLSTGDYDVNGENAQDEIARLERDASKYGKKFMIIRGIAQASSPSAPAPQFVVEQGPNLVIAVQVAERYRKRARKIGWDAAFEELLQEYGPDTALLLAQPKSESLVPGLSATTDQLRWERSNPELVSRYPDTWAMFAPNTGEFDIGGYTMEFERGQRAKLTPDQMIRKANHRLASHLYYRQREAFELSGGVDEREQAILRELKEKLRADFPGYEPEVSKNRLPVYISQLEDAVKDPALADTEAGRGITAYFEAREAAYAAARRMKYTSPWIAQKAKPIRDRLYQIAQDIIDEYPDFRVAWEEVFLYEFKDR